MQRGFGGKKTCQTVTVLPTTEEDCEMKTDPVYKPALSLLRLVFDGNKQQLQLHVTQPVKNVHSLVICTIK